MRPVLVPVGVDQDPHIRLSRDVANAHRFYNVKITKDNRIGVFVKIDNNVPELLDEAEKTLKQLGFQDLHRITEYKAIYIKNASEKDIDDIDEKLAKIEPMLGGYGFISPSATFHRFMTGLTGEKMSSSKPETAIFLSDKKPDIEKKIMNAKTGGAVSLKEQREKGGQPDKCMIYELFLYHLIEDDEKLKNIYEACKKGEQTCGQCKKLATNQTLEMLNEIQNMKQNIDEKTIKQYLL